MPPSEGKADVRSASAEALARRGEGETPSAELDAAIPLLHRGTPEDVFHAISQGDPLRLFPRCATELQAQAFLLDPERVYERALLRVARAAGTAPDADLFGWVGARVSDAIQDILRADQDESRSGAPVDEADERFWFLIETLGVEPEKTLEASVAFNRLGPRERHAFFAVVLQGRPVHECVEAGMGTQDELIRRTRIALAALLDIPSFLRLNEKGFDRKEGR